MRKNILHILFFAVLSIQNIGCSKDTPITTSVTGKSLVEIKEAFYTYVYIDRPVTRQLDITYKITDGLVVSATGSHTNFFYGDEADRTNSTSIEVNYEYLPNTSLISTIFLESISDIENVSYTQRVDYEYDSQNRLINASIYYTSAAFPDQQNFLLGKFERDYNDMENSFVENISSYYIEPIEADGIFEKRLVSLDSGNKPVRIVFYPTYFFLEDANNIEEGSITEYEYVGNNLSKVYNTNGTVRSLIWEFEYSENNISQEYKEVLPTLARFNQFGFSSYPYFEDTARSFADVLLKTTYEGDGDIYRFYESTISEEGIPLKIKEYLGLDSRISFEREYIYR